MNNIYFAKPSRPIKIKSVRDLYLRWRHAVQQYNTRPDAVCGEGSLKGKGIYNRQVASYVFAAEIILDNYNNKVENLTEDELELLKTITKTKQP